MRSYIWSLIGSSFWEIQGPLIGFIGIVLAILLWRFPIGTKASIDWLIWIIFFSLLLIITLFRAICKIHDDYQKIQLQYKEALNKVKDIELKINRRLIPKILYAKQIQTNTGLQIECLLENSELLSNDTYISFYYTGDDEFERLIGTGVVITVQANGKIQALMNNPINAYQDILDKLAINDTNVLVNTVVKPGITRGQITS